MVTEQEFSQANKRAEQAIRQGPLAQAITFDLQSNQITVTLDRGYAISFPPARVQGLQTATPQDLEQVEFTMNGLGLYFPTLDCDLSVPALAQGIFGSKAWESEWLRLHSAVKAA